MAQNGSKWLKMAPKGYIWLSMALNSVTVKPPNCQQLSREWENITVNSQGNDWLDMTLASEDGQLCGGEVPDFLPGAGHI